MIGFVAVVGAIVVCVFGIAALFVVYGAWNAFVIYKLWAWLLVPIFGFHALTMWQAYALSLFVSTLWHHQQCTSDKKETASEVAGQWAGPFISGALALLIGAVVRGHI